MWRNSLLLAALYLTLVVACSKPNNLPPDARPATRQAISDAPASSKDNSDNKHEGNHPAETNADSRPATTNAGALSKADAAALAVLSEAHFAGVILDLDKVRQNPLVQKMPAQMRSDLGELIKSLIEIRAQPLYVQRFTFNR